MIVLRADGSAKAGSTSHMKNAQPSLHPPLMWGEAGTLMTSPESRVTDRSSHDLSRTFSGLRSVWISLIEWRNSTA